MICFACDFFVFWVLFVIFFLKFRVQICSSCTHLGLLRGLGRLQHRGVGVEEMEHEVAVDRGGVVVGGGPGRVGVSFGWRDFERSCHSSLMGG